MDTPTTADRILDAAQDLLVTDGFHAFSYRDIAARVGIKTASIHYYFPSKTDVVEAVLARTRERFDAELAQVDRTQASAGARLRRFIAMFETALGSANRLCPFCVTALAIDDMPPAVRAQLAAFWNRSELWLADVFEAGRMSGEFKFNGSAAASARACLALIEGAMVAARGFGDTERFSVAVQWLEANLKPESQPIARGRRLRAEVRR